MNSAPVYSRPRRAPPARRRLGGLALILLLGACATPVQAPHPAWPARQAALGALRAWNLNGRLAVTNEQDGWHASLYWVQQGAVYAIDLVGPLGQGRVQIQGDARTVSIRTADGKTQQADDPDALLEQAVGVRIPLRGLVYWVRGLPDPVQPSALAFDEQGRLSHLEQDGWTLDYLDYMAVDRLALPRRMRAWRGDLKVQIVVNDWTLQPSSGVAAAR